MKLMERDQRGFTLIELVVGVFIIALVVLGASMAIIQLVNAGRSSTHMTALRQVQTAGFWVSGDGLQAQIVVDNDPETLAIDVYDDPETDGTEILILQWTDWDDGDVYEIQYSLQDMPSGTLKKLWRYETITPEVGDPTSHTTLVAQYIDGNATSCEWTSETKQAFTFDVAATVEQQTESRTYEIKPRPLA